MIQEIQLSDIVKLDQVPLPEDSVVKSRHVFELSTIDTVFFCGEDCEQSVCSDEKGLGRQLAQWMEAAIRQALLPVTPTSSASRNGKLRSLVVHVSSGVSLSLYRAPWLSGKSSAL